MDRPVTSKPRGICRYYATPRGCFAGDNCKFLHGADEKLTPYDKAKVCRYYARGHCARGDRCWFRHVLLKVAPDDERIRFNAEMCCICLEKPTTYGLLTDCSHVFCLDCIHQWRTPASKSPDAIASGTIKCCPLCRTPSRFVTPSAHFFPNESPRKKEMIDAYKASMARVTCKYFEETSSNGKPCCPFGTDCFYQHINSDGTPHEFRHGAKHSMNVYRRHLRRGISFPATHFDDEDPVQFLQHILDDPISNLHATLDVIRASLPVLLDASSNELENHDSLEEGEIIDGFFDPFEPLEDNSSTQEEAAASLPSTAEEDGPRSTPSELPSEYVSVPTGMPLPFGSRAASQAQPARLLSRFSTVMNSHARQTFIIDISDDDEEEESVQNESDAVESLDSPLLTVMPVPQSPPEQQPTALQSAGDLRTDVSLNHTRLEHDVDPPFMTDGRGRVVWSSTGDALGRSTTAEGRGIRYSRTGSTPRIACSSPGSTLPMASARVRACSGQDVRGIDGKVSGGEECNGVD